MKTTTHSVSRHARLLIAVGVLALLASPVKAAAADNTPSAHAPLAKGSGYDRVHGSKRVKVLQQRLRLADENPGPVDGLFGPRTEAAVIHYQRRAGLAVDGLVGPETWSAIRRSANVLRLGEGYEQARGSARVRTLQRSLRLAGAQPGPIDGRFGPKTKAAVMRFQRSHRLAVDGAAGTFTMTALARTASNVADHRATENGRVPAAQEVLHSVTRAIDGREVHAVIDRPVARVKLIIALILLLLVPAAAIAISRSRTRKSESTGSAAVGRGGPPPRRRTN